jgi:hypothetical protein
VTYNYLDKWPDYSRDPADILQLDPTKPCSCDLEWTASEVPDVLGLSDGVIHITVPYDDGIEYFLHLLKLHPNLTIAGHNFCASDLPLLLKRDIPIRLDQIEDTILYHWLVNQHLCKSSGKAALDEENGTELRGRGFLNLGTFASIYTNFPHWKTCRGDKCSGPCPKHDQMWYNAIDCASVAEGLPAVKRQAQLRGVDKLYPLHRELAWVLAQMREFGVRIDVPYVFSQDTHPLGSTDGRSLDEEFRRERERIRLLLPFNPQSPPQVTAHFKSLGLKDAQEETVSDLVDDLGDNAPEELKLLLEFKELGNGVDRWFQSEYRDKNGWLKGYLDRNGYVHPRLNPFTSTGRLACSSPNFQNIYVRKGEQIRKAIIAPEGYYLVRADYSNAENRVVLHYSGYSVPRETDLHTWVAQLAGLRADMDFVQRVGGGSPRQAAKSVQHASNILEGLQLKTPDALRSSRIQSEIKAGARVVFPHWTFRGKIVTFTGVNLSRRVYGNATFDHRAQALKIQETYFDRFPDIRKFQQRVSKQCEMENVVRTPLGYVLLSFGDDEERMKIAQGMAQQNPIAHLTKLALVRLWKRWERDRKMRCILQIHDELLCIVKEDVDPKVAMGWLQEDMEVEMPEIPGLIIPADPTYGRSWAKSEQLS